MVQSPRKKDSSNRPKHDSKSDSDKVESESDPGHSSEISKSKILALPAEKRLEATLAYLEKEPMTSDFLVELTQLLKNQIFRSDFLHQKGFDKLSVHLVKKSESSVLIQILTLLSEVF